jgi:hypothetical protein
VNTAGRRVHGVRGGAATHGREGRILGPAELVVGQSSGMVQLHQLVQLMHQRVPCTSIRDLSNPINVVVWFVLSWWGGQCTTKKSAV